MSGCARQGCAEEGTHHPVLLAMPANRPDYAGPPLELVIGILVCPTHQAGAVAADFVTDEGWAMIVGATTTVGRAEPDRASLGLVWKLPAFVGEAFGR